MYVFHIDTSNDIDKIEKMIKQGKHVFILIYMEGCGPCNATRPEWAKIESALKQQYASNDNLAVIDVNKDLIASIKSLGQIDGFPTMKYISKKGHKIENYEDSGVTKKDRSVDSFINWIELNVNSPINKIKTASVSDVYKRLSKTKKHHKKAISKKKGGAWSKKYKRSINCKRPRGFSQKQYCKYGRKK
jgi:thiol-disulfide isomerase/thioredoxin